MRLSRWRTTVLSLAVVVTLLAVAVRPAPVAAAPDFSAPQYTRTVGRRGHAGLYPWGAATAKDGTILIGDYWNGSIRRFSPAGKLLGTFAGKTTLNPHGVAVDPTDGSVYTADMNAPWEIDKYSAAGQFLFTIKTYTPGVTIPYPYVTRVEVDSRGWLYAVSSHDVASGGEFQNRVLVYDGQGKFQYTFGENGDADRQLRLIRGFDIGPRDELYLLDAGTGRVKVFSRTGEFRRAFAAAGTGPGELSGDARGLRVDGDDGWVYVVDAGASQIEKYALDGRPLLRWGSAGSRPGQFRDGGRELTIGRDNNVYAPDFGNNRVNVYDPRGRFLRSFTNAPNPAPDGGFNRPEDVAVDATGAIYVADTFNHRIQKFSAAGRFLSTWGFRGSEEPQAMNYPRGIAVDASTGQVWLSNSRQGDVKVYGPDGRFVRSFWSWGSERDQLNLARGLSVGRDRLVVADSNNRRLKVADKLGNVAFIVPCGGPPAGALFLLEGCTGVTEDVDGNIYAAAPTEHAVYKFGPRGELLRKWGTQGRAPGQLDAPYDVALHAGRLYVTESGNSRISVFTLAGDFVGAFGAKGSRPGQLGRPHGVAADAAGNLYVTDAGNERVTVFRIP